MPLPCTPLLLVGASVGASQHSFAITLGNLLLGPWGENHAQSPQPPHLPASRLGTGEGAASASSLSGPFLSY